MTVESTVETAVLEARDLAVHFGGVRAVDGVSFQVTPGKIFGLLGPNGSGKSTLLGAITRLVPLTHGSLLLDGEPFHRVSAADVARRRVARTFQTVRLLSDLTVLENVQLGGDLGPGSFVSRVFGRSAAPAVTEAIARTRLTGLEKLRPGELTAGMNQSERREISDLLKQLRSEGLTQLLVEHDVQMMIDTCDYLLAMNFGKLIAAGPPDVVVRDPAVQQAYLGKKWREQHA
jgi:branched-chain amino acid transport system ATP-binding protein